MRVRSRLPAVVVAAALLGLIALLATLQYRWLGQISTAERERMTANLASRTSAFAEDFDRELTRAYITFQLDPAREGDNLAARFAERYDRWQATSRFPRMLKDVLVVGRASSSDLQRYNPSTRFVEPARWPAELEPVRTQLAAPPVTAGQDGTIFVQGIPSLWSAIPAVVVPAPVIVLSDRDVILRHATGDVRIEPAMRYTVLVLDRNYLTAELLPALATQHLRDGVDETQYEMAVVDTEHNSTVFATTPRMQQAGASGDATAAMFQVRLQEFGAMVSEVRRFLTFTARRGAADGSAPGAAPRTRVNTLTFSDKAPVSLLFPPDSESSPQTRRARETSILAAAAGKPAATQPRWQLVVKHPSGSLESAVASARRRNLLVSSGILAVLGVSIGLLVVSTRRAHDLARQQMEFVAAVSHELRTPLAVIRSAAENLADGVVSEGQQVRRYGELVKDEGRRLTEMVEQILELSGIHSGQRGFSLRPLAVLPLLHDVARSSTKLVDDAGVRVEFDVPETLPAVIGDEQALRRVFQNLFGNAVKYGASGGWIGVRARATGRDVQVTVADKGIGIAPADQAHIFEPFYRAPGVIEAQIHGAGLGLSLVDRIVQAHGGRITVRSAPGEGSEFTVHLPAASAEPVTRTSAAADPAHRLS